MRKAFLKVIVCIACLFIYCVPVFAAESASEISFTQDAQSVSGQVMALSGDTKAYKDKDESSEVAQSFAKGDSVYVVEEADGWYQIFYKGENLYIPVSSISSEAAIESQEQAQELAKEASEELKVAEKRDVAEIEAYERQKRSKRNARIWEIVIGVLVVSMIVVSVITGIKKSKEEDKKEETKVET